MKKNYKFSALVAGIVFGFFACQDPDLEVVPEWESAVNTFASLQTGSSANFLNGNAATPINLNFRWISIDGKNTVNRVEFFILFNEGYVDVDGNPKTARHGGDEGILFKTLEGAAVAGNRTDMSLSVTQAEIYELYKDKTFNYCGTTESVFNSTLKPSRSTDNPFVAGDAFTLKWIVYTEDGRKFDSWSPSVCTEFPGSNCQFGWAVICNSNLATDYSYTTTNIKRAGAPFPGTLTGTGSLTEGSEGSYTLTDFSFGVFAAAYGDDPAVGSLTLSDACDFISSKGVDQYGDSYTYTITAISATSITFDWVNTYGDGGTTTITRATGAWPTTLSTTPSGSCN